MWASRWSLLVLIEVRSISAVTEESVGFSAVTIVASNVVNLPLTLLTIMWRTLKATSEWVASIFQVPTL